MAYEIIHTGTLYDAEPPTDKLQKFMSELKDSDVTWIRQPDTRDPTPVVLYKGKSGDKKYFPLKPVCQKTIFYGVGPEVTKRVLDAPEGGELPCDASGRPLVPRCVFDEIRKNSQSKRGGEHPTADSRPPKKQTPTIGQKAPAGVMPPPPPPPPPVTAPVTAPQRVASPPAPAAAAAAAPLAFPAKFGYAPAFHGAFEQWYGILGKSGDAVTSPEDAATRAATLAEFRDTLLVWRTLTADQLLRTGGSSEIHLAVIETLLAHFAPLHDVPDRRIVSDVFSFLDSPAYTKAPKDQFPEGVVLKYAEPHMASIVGSAAANPAKAEAVIAKYLKETEGMTADAICDHFAMKNAARAHITEPAALDEFKASVFTAVGIVFADLMGLVP